MSASAFSLSIAVPGDAFSVSGLEPEIGGLHGKERHHFCPWCKSWMFTRVEYMDGFVNVRASVLDEHHWVVPYAWQKPQAGRRPSGSRRRVTPLRRATRNPFGPFRRTGAST